MTLCPKLKEKTCFRDQRAFFIVFSLSPDHYKMMTRGSRRVAQQESDQRVTIGVDDYCYGRYDFRELQSDLSNPLVAQQ